MVDLVLLWIEIELRANGLFLWQWSRIFGTQSPRCISLILHGRLQSSKPVSFLLGVNRQLVTRTRAWIAASKWVTAFRAFIIDNDNRYVAMVPVKSRFALTRGYLFLLFLILRGCLFLFFYMRWSWLFQFFLILRKWNLPVINTFFALLWWILIDIDLAFKWVN